MSKKQWKEIQATLDKVAAEAAEGIGQLRGKSGNRAQPLDTTEDIINRFDGTLTPEEKERSKRYMERLLGKTPLRQTPPDDMPAIEKIKLYARSGYHLHHIGTDEDFQRVWVEVFPEEKKGRKK